MESVAIGITVYRNPARLEKLLANMIWSGLPDIPVYVFQDRSPFEDSQKITDEYINVVNKFPCVEDFYTSAKWGCMQGSIQQMMMHTIEDWMIYVPDDVAFPRGGLWNEYAGVLAYGRKFVGGIQAPYWNMSDLLGLGAVGEEIWEPEFLEQVKRNPHWDGAGVPRKYINLNGAGFSINRRLWEDMGGWPSCTWRLDEYAGYKAWMLGYSIITLPGPPRIHMFGGSTHYQPVDKPRYDSVEAWKEATGGYTPEETGQQSRIAMQRISETVIPDGCFNDILEFYGNVGNGR